MIRLGTIMCCAFWAATAMGQSLSFPSNAKMTREVERALESYGMPIGPWVNGTMETETAEGHFTQQAWKIDAAGLTNLQMIRPLRDQLRNTGYDVVFECRDADCGGFDFRFETSILPPPEMQINLGDFWYLAARKADGPELISLFASRSERAGFLQVTRVGPNAPADTKATSEPVRGTATLVQTGDLSTSLTQTGRVVLDGLEFASGSSRLAEGSNASLQALADFLAAQPDLTVALVGHTDASGSLEGNIALSKRRAGSVLERLVSDYAVDRSQLDAQGMGYLAPVQSNLTAEGRTANRRVEVIITTTR